MQSHVESFRKTLPTVFFSACAHLFFADFLQTQELKSLP